MAESNQGKLIEAFLGPAQELDDVFVSLCIDRRSDTATGVTLGMIGKLVGQPRNGVDDDDIYRRYVRARIAANASHGRIRDVIKVARLIVDDTNARYHVHLYGPAQFTLTLEDIVLDVDIASIVASFLRDTAGAGIRVVTEYWPDIEEKMFAMGSATGIETEGSGMGATFDDDIGGALAGAIE